MMDRREALSAIALLVGGTLVGAEAFLTGCKTTGKKEGLFAAEDIALLDEVGDTILPTTASSPGAKAAKIDFFMVSCFLLGFSCGAMLRLRISG